MAIFKIQKRNGSITTFDRNKIELAINKAIEAVGGNDFSQTKNITDKVIEYIENKVGNNMPSIEQIQDTVEEVLIKEGHDETAKAYIKYRQKRQEQRKNKNVVVEVEKTMQDYLDNLDRRINENANMGYSIGGLILKNSEKITANYRLSHIYPEEIGNAHRNADFHIHDLGMFAPYCAGRSLRALLEEGLNGVPDKVASSPAKHLNSAINQIVNFLGVLQNERAGAQAFSSFDTYLSPFVHKYEEEIIKELDDSGIVFQNNDKKEEYINKKVYKYVYQCMQNFMFGMNTPSRRGTQTPFSNITLDWTCPPDLKDKALLLGGIKSGPYKKKFGELKKYMDMINKALITVYTQGDINGRVFTFPIPTYNITEDFDRDSENSKMLFEMTAKYGIPYFQNFIGSQYMKDENGNKVKDPKAYSPDAVRSMCPLVPTTPIFVKSKQNGIRKTTIKDVIHNMETKGTKYQVWSTNGRIDAKPIKTEKTKVYKITMSNGIEIEMGKDHLQPTKENGVLHGDELKIGMKLPFNKKAFEGVGGSYELGYAIGTFLGDGSKDNEGINYSLAGEGTDENTKNKLTSFWSNLGYPVNITNDGKLMSLRVGMNSFDLIKRFIIGDSALTKGMTKNCFNLSIECRKGILEGYADTDGSKEKKRLYTSSQQLREDLVSLLFSLGMKAIATNIDNRDGRLGNNPAFRIDYPGRDKYGELYDEDDNFHYFYIQKIEEVSYKGQYLYCIEVKTDDHLFALGNGLITHNCRLQLDLNELKKRGGGLFGSAEMTGSVGVVTINMARIGYNFKGDKDGFKQRVKHLMNLAKNSLEIKRKEVEKRHKSGLYMYTQRYLPSFRSHFSTIGLLGMNESVINFTDGKEDITTKEGQKFALEIMDFMRNILTEYQEETGNLYNLEATPGEGTTYRFAREDQNQLPGIIQAGTTEAPYYTNSTQIPVEYSDDIFEIMDLQDDLQCKYTGGTVLHIYLGERVSNSDSCKELVKKCLSNYRMPYISITPTFSVCPKHGYIIGEHDFCPKCDAELGYIGDDKNRELRKKHTSDKAKK